MDQLTFQSPIKLKEKSIKNQEKIHSLNNGNYNLADANGSQDLSTKLFDDFCSSNNLFSILDSFSRLREACGISASGGKVIYTLLKHNLKCWKAQNLWSKLDKKLSSWEYDNANVASHLKIFVIGCGPCGLRMAIEAAMLGGEVAVVEKRDDFTRNNVLHLWSFLIFDLKSLGAKHFFGKFCSGSIDHICIRTLQCILLKVALLLGVRVFVGVEYLDLVAPGDPSEGWRAKVMPKNSEVSRFEFDVVISADGRRNTLPQIKRVEFRGKLAIAITANFVNNHSAQEASVEEISGVSYIFNQPFFKDLSKHTGIDLENIVYYKDQTHYFIMTAKKQNLLIKKVLLRDYDDPEVLLSKGNVDQKALLSYAKEAASFSTNHKLPNLEFATNQNRQPDVSMFDFTSMYAAENSCMAMERRGRTLLVGLVGDTLVEPFWPTGSGCARGFLSVFDAAWMIRNLSSGHPLPQVLAERESIYQILSQTTSENLNKNYHLYTIDPNTRYLNLNLTSISPHQVMHLIDGSVPHQVLPQPRVLKQIQTYKQYDICEKYKLLKWCQQQLASYEGSLRLQVVDLFSSWTSGIALCALAHSINPDLIDLSTLDKRMAIKNLEKGFELLRKELGVASCFSAEDLLTNSLRGEHLLTSYLAQVKDSVQASEEKVEDTLDKIISRAFPSKEEKEEISEEEQKSLFIEPKDSYIKQLFSNQMPSSLSPPSSLPPSSSSSSFTSSNVNHIVHILSNKLNKNNDTLLKLNTSICHSCKQRVYLVQQLVAEDKIFHRNCFVCSYCSCCLHKDYYSYDKHSDKFYCKHHFGLIRNVDDFYGNLGLNPLNPAPNPFKKQLEETSWIETGKRKEEKDGENEKRKEKREETGKIQERVGYTTEGEETADDYYSNQDFYPFFSRSLSKTETEFSGSDSELQNLIEEQTDEEKPDIGWVLMMNKRNERDMGGVGGVAESFGARGRDLSEKEEGEDNQMVKEKLENENLNLVGNYNKETNKQKYEEIEKKQKEVETEENERDGRQKEREWRVGEDELDGRKRERLREKEEEEDFASSEASTVDANDADWETDSEEESQTILESLNYNDSKQQALKILKEEINKIQEKPRITMETKQTPFLSSALNNRMSFFSEPAQPIRIDARSFLGLDNRNSNLEQSRLLIGQENKEREEDKMKDDELEKGKIKEKEEKFDIDYKNGVLKNTKFKKKKVKNKKMTKKVKRNEKLKGKKSFDVLAVKKELKKNGLGDPFQGDSKSSEDEEEKKEDNEKQINKNNKIKISPHQLIDSNKTFIPSSSVSSPTSFSSCSSNSFFNTSFYSESKISRSTYFSPNIYTNDSKSPTTNYNEKYINNKNKNISNKKKSSLSFFSSLPTRRKLLPNDSILTFYSSDLINKNNKTRSNLNSNLDLQPISNQLSTSASPVRSLELLSKERKEEIIKSELREIKEESKTFSLTSSATTTTTTTTVTTTKTTTTTTTTTIDSQTNSVVTPNAHFSPKVQPSRDSSSSFSTLTITSKNDETKNFNNITNIITQTSVNRIITTNATHTDSITCHTSDTINKNNIINIPNSSNTTTFNAHASSVITSNNTKFTKDENFNNIYHSSDINNHSNQVFLKERELLGVGNQEDLVARKIRTQVERASEVVEGLMNGVVDWEKIRNVNKKDSNEEEEENREEEEWNDKQKKKMDEFEKNGKKEKEDEEEDAVISSSVVYSSYKQEVERFSFSSEASLDDVEDYSLEEEKGEEERRKEKEERKEEQVNDKKFKENKKNRKINKRKKEEKEEEKGKEIKKERCDEDVEKKLKEKLENKSEGEIKEKESKQNSDTFNGGSSVDRSYKLSEALDSLLYRQTPTPPPEVEKSLAKSSLAITLLDDLIAVTSSSSSSSQSNFSIDSKPSETQSGFSSISSSTPNPSKYPLSPGKLVDAKRKFFFEPPQPVRIDHKALFSNIDKNFDKKNERNFNLIEENEDSSEKIKSLNADKRIDELLVMSEQKEKNGKKNQNERKKEKEISRINGKDSDGKKEERIGRKENVEIEINGNHLENLNLDKEKYFSEPEVQSDVKNFSRSEIFFRSNSGKVEMREKRGRQQDIKNEDKEKRKSFLFKIIPLKSEKKQKPLDHSFSMQMNQSSKLDSTKQKTNSLPLSKKQQNSKRKQSSEKNKKKRPHLPYLSPFSKKSSLSRSSLNSNRSSLINLRTTSFPSPDLREVLRDVALLIQDLKTGNDSSIKRQVESIAPLSNSPLVDPIEAPKADLDDFDTESETEEENSSRDNNINNEKNNKQNNKELNIIKKKYKEKERDRLQSLQEVVRKLEEVEIQQHQVEERGVEIERILRGEGKASYNKGLDQLFLFQEWFNAIQEKNYLTRYESELIVQTKELQLEDKQCQLQLQLQENIYSPGKNKMPEEEVMVEIMNCVNKRDKLVRLLEEERLKHKQCDLNIQKLMKEKGITQTNIEKDEGEVGKGRKESEKENQTGKESKNTKLIIKPTAH